MTILIVDDELRIRDGLRSMVLKAPVDGIEVFTAGSAAEATGIFDERQVDLLLADINMPEESGLEMIDRMKAAKPDLIVGIITGYERFEYAKRAVDLAVDSFLLKPVAASELHSLISKAADTATVRTETRNRSRWLDSELGSRLGFHRNDFFSQLISGRAGGELSVSVLALGLDRFRSAWLCILDAREPWPDEQSVSEADSDDRLILSAMDGPDRICLLTGTLFSSLGEHEVKSRLEELSEGRRIYPLVRRAVRLELGWEAVHEAVAALRRDSASSYSRIVSAADNLIERNYSDADFSLKQAAETLNLSSGYLSREYKKESGRVFMDALNDYRIRAAASLIEAAEPGVKIYEIAEKCGFSSQHYFSRIFRVSTGMSPKEYRKRLNPS